MSRVEIQATDRFWVLLRRRWGRIAFFVLGTFAVMLVGGCAWHWTCLRNLPDVGEPFDVQAFEAQRVPDFENAFVLYREALRRLKPSDLPGLTPEIQAARRKGWGARSSELRSYVERKRDALEVWKHATERPGASPDGWSLEEIQALNEFPILALLEAARLREEGDMAGAWEYYRAIHRMSRHYQRRGGILVRMWGLGRLVFFRDEVLTWSGDLRVSPALLRRALNDVLATEDLAVPNVETLKGEYVDLMLKINDPVYRKRAALTPEFARRGWEASDEWYRYLCGYEELADFLRREPERSRRVARLVFTNWMAHADGIRPFRSKYTDAHPDLFMNQPTTPAMAIVYPSDLSDWLTTTRIQDFGMPNYRSHNHWREKERSIVDTVVMRLATELYIRDHGCRPASDRELIGPYLERLPDGHPEAE